MFQKKVEDETYSFNSINSSLYLVYCQIILKAIVESPCNHVIPTSHITITIKIVADIWEYFFLSAFVHFAPGQLFRETHELVLSCNI